MNVVDSAARRSKLGVWTCGISYAAFSSGLRSSTITRSTLRRDGAVEEGAQRLASRMALLSVSMAVLFYKPKSEAEFWPALTDFVAAIVRRPVVRAGAIYQNGQLHVLAMVID